MTFPQSLERQTRRPITAKYVLIVQYDVYHLSLTATFSVVFLIVPTQISMAPNVVVYLSERRYNNPLVTFDRPLSLSSLDVPP